MAMDEPLEKYVLVTLAKQLAENCVQSTVEQLISERRKSRASDVLIGTTNILCLKITCLWGISDKIFKDSFSLF
jgi:hypothetical protein